MAIPLNILQLGSPAGLYGAERWILALIKYLDPEKIQTIVGVIKDRPGDDAPLCKEAQLRGFDTCEIEAFGRFNFTAVCKLRQFITDHHVDILHTHFYKTDLLGLLAVRGTKCKLISTPHGWSTKADFKLQCYEWLDRCLFPFMDAVAPLSDDLYEPLAQSNLYNMVNRLVKRNVDSSKELSHQKGYSLKENQINELTNLHLITNGVDLSEVEECTAIAPELGSIRKSGSFIIGYIGQLIPRKGLEVLLRALAQLEISLSWQLALVGEGEQREELEKLVGDLNLTDHVHFFGYRQNRLEFLNGFDLFVLPSRLEGIPRCLMEAMSAKKLILASDIPGCNDLITDKKNGLLFEVDNVDNLTESLESVVRQPEQYSDLAQVGYEHVNKRYSASRMAEEYQQLYYSLK